MNKNTIVLAIVCTLAMQFISAPAFASNITVYADRVSFDAAVGSTTTENFLDTSHLLISSGILNQFTNEAGINPGDIQPGVTYSTPIGTGLFFNIDAGPGSGYTGGFLDGIRSGDPSPLTITFDTPVSAFGFDTNIRMGTDFDLTINFTQGADFDADFVVMNSSDMEFFGFQSDFSDITSVVIQGYGDVSLNFALDNFSFGGTAVPVPAALWLFGSGLISLFGMARTKRRN